MYRVQADGSSSSERVAEMSLSDGQAEPAVTRPRVLVVDDSADMRHLIADILTPHGYEVVGASSAPRALARMGEQVPDLVIIDLLMPGMSGFTLRALMLRRQELARVPVVVLSAYWDRPGETLEAEEVLTKPLNIDRLVETVQRLAVRSRRVAS